MASKSRIHYLFLALVLVVAGAGLALALLRPVAGWLDHRVTVEPKRGRPTDTIVRFGTPRPERLERVADGPVRNVVLLLGDGLGFSQLSAARAATVGPDGRLFLERFPVTAWVSTHSLERLYTDSAAGATALATGRKTAPRMLAVTPDGEPLESLWHRAREHGKAAGLITDSYLWDASPAAFAARRASRGDSEGIVADFAASGFELLVGEEHPGFTGDDPGSELLAAFADHGYSEARDAAALRAAGQGPLLGLLPFGAIADPDTAPSLADLTRLALDRLGQDPEGFVLLVETEETDTGGHGGDTERMIEGVASLDAVAEVAVDFARADGHTLVLATSDHETGGMAVLLGREGQPMTVRWATTSHTAEPVPLLAWGPGAEQLSGVLDNTEVPAILARLLGLGDLPAP